MIMPSKVFISYRREDSRYQARSMYEAFVKALPPGHVFMDTDSITPGVRFADVLEKWIAQCDVLIALIGPGWINAIDPVTGQRRLDNPNDFVRLEIRGALKREIPVVPVLLDATPMPKEDQLPEDIKGLTGRHAEQVDFRTFDVDVVHLMNRLGPVTPPAAGGRSTKWLAVAVGAALAAIGAVVYWSNGPAPPPRNSNQIDLAKSEEARRAAAEQAAASASAQAKADEARRAAEAKASEAAAALAKSEEARRTAEAQATAAARLAADAQAAIAARRAEEAAAANKARETAEQQAAMAVRQAADAQDALAARQAADAARASQQTPPARPSQPPIRPFLERIGANSQWAIGGNCGNPRDSNFYSLAAGGGSITWTNGLGSVDVESVVFSDENEFHTTTRMSRHVRGDSVGIGQTWTYSRDGERIRVRRGGGNVFILTRCS